MRPLRFNLPEQMGHRHLQLLLKLKRLIQSPRCQHTFAHQKFAETGFGFFLAQQQRSQRGWVYTADSHQDIPQQKLSRNVVAP